MRPDVFICIRENAPIEYYLNFLEKWKNDIFKLKIVLTSLIKFTPYNYGYMQIRKRCIEYGSKTLTIQTAKQHMLSYLMI